MNKPHVYQHIPPSDRTLVDLLVTPAPLEVICERMSWSRRQVEYASLGIRSALGIEQSLKAWRLAIARLYFGIDPCWCQA